MKIEVRQRELKFDLFVEGVWVQKIDAVTAEAIRHLQAEIEELEDTLREVIGSAGEYNIGSGVLSRAKELIELN